MVCFHKVSQTFLLRNLAFPRYTSVKRVLGIFRSGKFHPSHVHSQVQSETVKFLYVDADHDIYPNPKPYPFTWWNLAEGI